MKLFFYRNFITHFFFIFQRSEEFGTTENCELSDLDLNNLQLNNPTHFDIRTRFDYYIIDSSTGISGKLVGYFFT